MREPGNGGANARAFGHLIVGTAFATPTHKSKGTKR